MKLSLKFQGHGEHQSTTQLMTAKLPITILNHSFISGITASTTNNNTPSDFSFSLSSNFPSGPSLKLTYFPTTTTTTSFPFSLSLKSGLGIFGSPHHSPLVFNANFSLSSTYTPIPTFFLHFKPQFGHFSLNKTVFSDTNTENVSGSLSNGGTPSGTALNSIDKGVVGDASSSGWQELKLEPCVGKHPTHVVENRDGDDSNVGGAVGFVPQRSVIGKSNGKRGVSPRVALMATTLMPVTKGFLLNLRWGVNFPGDSGVKMPYLTVNKIGLEKIEEVKPNEKNGGKDPSESDLQLMKGMCFWMKRDLENVEKENRELKRMLDKMRMGVSTSKYREGNIGGVGKKLSQQHSSGESSSEFERWRGNRKSGRGEENEKKEPKNPQSLANDVESELQKAIKAASS